MIRAERVERARRTVDRLAELGAEVSFDRVMALAGEGTAVGRPHIAAAMAEAGVVPDADAAFSLDWIGTGGRAYVPKLAVTPLRAVELIRAAHGSPCSPIRQCTRARRRCPKRSSGRWPRPGWPG